MNCWFDPTFQVGKSSLRSFHYNRECQLASGLDSSQSGTKSAINFAKVISIFRVGESRVNDRLKLDFFAFLNIGQCFVSSSAYLKKALVSELVKGKSNSFDEASVMPFIMFMLKNSI